MQLELELRYKIIYTLLSLPHYACLFFYEPYALLIIRFYEPHGQTLHLYEPYMPLMDEYNAEKALYLSALTNESLKTFSSPHFPLIPLIQFPAN
jgi:hypothetical protein